MRGITKDSLFARTEVNTLIYKDGLREGRYASEGRRDSEIRSILLE